MARYYCDYCDIFLTHDSLAVRKAHNSGWKHATAVREYYSTLGQDTTQGVIDQITSAYHSNAFNQGGPHFPPQFGPPPGFNFNRPPPQMQQQVKADQFQQQIKQEDH